MNKKIFTLAVLFVMAVCSALSVKAQGFKVRAVDNTAENQKYWIASPEIGNAPVDIYTFERVGDDLKSLKITEGNDGSLISSPKALLWTAKQDAEALNKYYFVIEEEGSNLYLAPAVINGANSKYTLHESTDLGIFRDQDKKAYVNKDGNNYYIQFGESDTEVKALAAATSPSLTVPAGASSIYFYTQVYKTGNSKDGTTILTDEAFNATTPKEVTIVIGDYCLVRTESGAEWKLITDVCNDTSGKSVENATWLWVKNGDDGCEFKNLANDKFLTIGTDGGFSLTDRAFEAEKTSVFLFDRETKYFAIENASLRGLFGAGSEGDVINANKDGDTEVTTGALLLDPLTPVEEPEPGPDPVVDLGDQILKSEFVSGNYYTLSSNGIDFLTMVPEGEGYKLDSTPIDDIAKSPDNALWEVTETVVANNIQIVFKNKATGQYLAYDQTSKTFGPAVTPGTSFFTSKDDEGYTDGGVQLMIGSQSVKFDSAVDPFFTLGDEDGPVRFFNPYIHYTADELLTKFGSAGFAVTIYNYKNGKDGVDGSEIFSGLLRPVQTGNETYLQLINSDGKFVVLDTKKVWAENNKDLNGTADEGEGENYVRGMRFDLVAKIEADHHSYFTLSHPIANENSDEVIIEVYEDASAVRTGRLYVPTVGNKMYLTISDDILKLNNAEQWAYVTLGKGKLATDADVIKGKFVNITLVTDKKVAGPTGLSTNPSLVQLGMPEGQFSIIRPTVDENSDVLAPEGTYAFVNRESQKMFTHASTATKAFTSNTTFRLYKTDTKDEYTLENGETIRLKYIDDTSTSDGYRSFDAAELKDLEFDLAVYSSVMGGNAYLMEKHEDTADHQIGLSKDKSDATIWKLEATDEIVHIIVPVGYLDNGVYKTRPDTLSITPFMVQNKSNNEYVIGKITETGKHFYFCDEIPKNKDSAQRFILKSMPDGNHNVVELYYNWEGDVKEWVYIQDVKKMPYAGYMRNGDIVAGKGFYTKEQAWLYNLSDGDLANDVAQKVYGGFSANKGTLSMVDIYDDVENDLIKLTEKSAPEYRTFNEAEVIRIFRHTNSAEVLYEKGEKDANGNVIVVGEFLGLENTHQYEEINPAIYLNYIRNTGNRPEYLLVLNPDSVPGIDEECEIPGHTPIHTMDTLKGRFLTNLIEKANAFDKIHTNKYVNAEGYAKLGFIPGSRVENTIFMPNMADDTKTDEVGLATDDRQIMKFAFRIVDTDSEAFVIETRYDAYTRVTGLPGNKSDGDNVGYLKWMNGYVVVVDRFEDADIFNSKEDKNPVNNDNLTTTDVKVIGGQGEVIIRNAANKVVTVNNIVGQTIASEVVSSDEATLHVPAGVAIVTVDGKAVKVLVK